MMNRAPPAATRPRAPSERRTGGIRASKRRRKKTSVARRRGAAHGDDAARAGGKKDARPVVRRGSIALMQKSKDDYDEEGELLNLSYTDDLFRLDQQVLSRKDRLTGLDLERCNIDDVDLISLSAAAKVCRRLVTLSLNKNDLTDAAAEKVCGIVNALEGTLLSLDLGHNKSLGHVFGLALGEVIASNETIQRVRVGRGWIPVERFRQGGDGVLDLSADLHPPVDGAFVSKLAVASNAPLEFVRLEGRPLPFRRLLYGAGGAEEIPDDPDAVARDARDETSRAARRVDSGGGHVDLRRSRGGVERSLFARAEGGRRRATLRPRTLRPAAGRPRPPRRRDSGARRVSSFVGTGSTARTRGSSRARWAPTYGRARAPSRSTATPWARLARSR